MSLAPLRLCLAAVAIVAAPLPGVAAEASQAPISGIFGNVQRSPETDDLSGLEIEFHTDQAQPYALVVFCEGWCNRAYRVPVKLSGNRFSLAFTEPLLDSSSGEGVAKDHYRIDGMRSGGSLLVNFRLNSNSWRMRLSPLKERFGLKVADPPAGESAEANNASKP